MTQLNNIVVGLLGFEYGKGFATVLESKAQMKAFGMRYYYKRFGESRINTKIIVPETLFTANADEILTDPEIQIVIELIGGVQPACDYITKALKQGKHVVTANKAVIALHGKELFALADKNSVSMRLKPA